MKNYFPKQNKELYIHANHIFPTSKDPLKLDIALTYINENTPIISGRIPEDGQTNSVLCSTEIESDKALLAHLPDGYLDSMFGKEDSSSVSTDFLIIRADIIPDKSVSDSTKPIREYLSPEDQVVYDKLHQTIVSFDYVDATFDVEVVIN